MTAGETGRGVDAWLLDGPKESKLRNERNEVRPPAAPGAGALWPEVGAGVPLTARSRVGETSPSCGVDNELGRPLWEGREEMTGM